MITEKKPISEIIENGMKRLTKSEERINSAMRNALLRLKAGMHFRPLPDEQASIVSDKVLLENSEVVLDNIKELKTAFPGFVEMTKGFATEDEVREIFGGAYSKIESGEYQVVLDALKIEMSLSRQPFMFAPFRHGEMETTVAIEKALEFATAEELLNSPDFDDYRNVQNFWKFEMVDNILHYRTNSNHGDIEPTLFRLGAINKWQLMGLDQSAERPE